MAVAQETAHPSRSLRCWRLGRSSRTYSHTYGVIRSQRRRSGSKTQVSGVIAARKDTGQVIMMRLSVWQVYG